MIGGGWTDFLGLLRPGSRKLSSFVRDPYLQGNLVADITLDQLLEMWEKDAKPDYNNIGETALLISKLHSKYLRIFSDHKLKIVKKQGDYTRLRRDKWIWFSGKMSREKLAQLGWDQNQVSFTKTKIEELLKSDEDLMKIGFLIAYHEAIVEASKSILFHLKDRSTNHRTALEHLRYVQGG